ncbi:hypothetical protein DFH11DRAFT_1858054 [Phellopilus nigrolimitatus]|nr:hypothetical protein DFH11DRAFT_1858054 [Phellopilus nigrolimitatus]
MRALATACYTSMDTPSSLAHPRAFRKLNQGSEKNLFHNLRPADARGKPVSLFHPVFGAFLRDLNDPELAMPSIDFATLFEFMGASAAFYRTEEARWEAVRPLLKQLTGLRFTRITLGNNTSPTRMARTSSHVASIIVEMRNELGADGDVTLHAAACYGKCIVDETFEDVVKTSCCPVILLVLAGAHLCVLGAVFTDKVVVEPLTDFILCVNRPEDAGARTGLLARLMQALRNAHARLDAYYAAVQAAPPPARTPIFPYRDSWTADGATSTFSYDRPVAPHKLLWFATLHGGKDEHIVVKFAKRYDADAHALLASAGYAPRLYHADPPSASNEWRMVVMERITIVELEHTTPEDRLALQQDVCAAVELLHDAGRVFGDLRQGNVLIQKPGADRPRPRAVLVDFDWAGREGEARYPYDRNDVNIEWPDGSRPGGVIERAHDAVWLERLVEYFS